MKRIVWVCLLAAFIVSGCVASGSSKGRAGIDPDGKGVSWEVTGEGEHHEDKEAE